MTSPARPSPDLGPRRALPKILDPEWFDLRETAILFHKLVHEESDELERVAAMVVYERIRQARRYSREHDQSHGVETLVTAAAVLMSDDGAFDIRNGSCVIEPWMTEMRSETRKDGGVLRQLVVAAALLQAAAELELVNQEAGIEALRLPELEVLVDLTVPLTHHMGEHLGEGKMKPYVIEGSVPWPHGTAAVEPDFEQLERRFVRLSPDEEEEIEEYYQTRGWSSWIGLTILAITLAGYLVIVAVIACLTRWMRGEL